jgi:hypothetical protein
VERQNWRVILKCKKQLNWHVKIFLEVLSILRKNYLLQDVSNWITAYYQALGWLDIVLRNVVVALK